MIIDLMLSNLYVVKSVTFVMHYGLNKAYFFTSVMHYGRDKSYFVQSVMHSGHDRILFCQICNALRT